MKLAIKMPNRLLRARAAPGTCAPDAAKPRPVTHRAGAGGSRRRRRARGFGMDALQGLLQALEHIEAAALRQLDVEQDQVGAVEIGGRHSRIDVIGRGGRRPGSGRCRA